MREADFARLIPDDIVTRFAFSGGYAEIARQVGALEPCGVDEVVLAIPVAPTITPRDVVMRELAPMLLSNGCRAIVGKNSAKQGMGDGGARA